MNIRTDTQEHWEEDIINTITPEEKTRFEPLRIRTREIEEDLLITLQKLRETEPPENPIGLRIHYMALMNELQKLWCDALFPNGRFIPSKKRGRPCKKATGTDGN